MDISSLEDAPVFTTFLEELAAKEDPNSRFKIAAYDLELGDSGKLSVQGKGEFSLAGEARDNLARMVEIPAPYFQDCDAELQAFSFNRRLQMKVPGGTSLQVTVSNDRILSVQKSNLLPAPRHALLDSVRNSIPSDVDANDVRVITHAWNGQFDISIIAPSLHCEPREDDIVAFGVNVSEGRTGAVQVQGAAFRLWCRNGAVNRVCDGRKHRIRRSINRQDQFLSRVEKFARQAWRQYPAHSEGLKKLAQEPIDLERQDDLLTRLRQAPFFLAAGVVNRILQRLSLEIAEQGHAPTLYDLYNAMTHLGTHNTELSVTQRTRLRYGAGEFSRNRARLCNTCKQLLVR